MLTGLLHSVKEEARLEKKISNALREVNSRHENRSASLDEASYQLQGKIVVH